jgi:hypothetical protein
VTVNARNVAMITLLRRHMIVSGVSCRTRDIVAGVIGRSTQGHQQTYPDPAE